MVINLKKHIVPKLLYDYLPGGKEKRKKEIKKKKMVWILH